MANRDSKFYNRMNILRPPNPQSFFDCIVAEAGNVFLTNLFKKASLDISDVLGLTGISDKEKARQERAQLASRQVDASIARYYLKEAEAKERREFNKLKQEKLARLYDLKIEQQEVTLEKAKQYLEDANTRQLNQRTEFNLHIVTEPIAGALEVTANPEGLTGSVGQQEAYKEWLDSFEEGKIIIVLGKRGSGKSAFCAKLSEYMMAIHRMPCYWIGLPEQARDLLPHWIKIVDSVEKCPVKSFVLCDESGLQFLSLRFQSSYNLYLRNLIQTARQRHVSLAFATQSSRDTEWSILRGADSVIFKQPSLNQPVSERVDLRSKAKIAALAFKEMPKQERIESAFVFDDDFTGIIKSTLPSFWTEELSHVYAHLDLSEVGRQRKLSGEVVETNTTETANLDDASLVSAVMDLRQQGMGLQRIAKALGIKIWRVRKILNV